jgi:hypothetical protein
MPTPAGRAGQPPLLLSTVLVAATPPTTKLHATATARVLASTMLYLGLLFRLLCCAVRCRRS